MTGAESLIRTALQAGVKVCFANPGTTEMDLVTAADSVPEMRQVLGLFEGVCTGMADGYARMAGGPALTLLHLGVGLGNGIANLHNARRAHSPIVNLVGDHPAAHLPYDAPLTSDIATLAKPMSDWVHTSTSSKELAADVARAIARAQGPPGRIATLICPADALRESADGPARIMTPERSPGVDSGVVDRVVNALRQGGPAALLLSGSAVLTEGLRLAHRVAGATGCKVFSDCFPARLERGAGVPPVQRIPYFPDEVLDRLSGLKYLILVGAQSPVSFFQYPKFPSSLVPEGCEAICLASREQDAHLALEALVDALGAAGQGVQLTEASRPDPPTGELDTKTIGAAIGATLPEGAIIADESATSGGPAYFLTQGCPPHTSMFLTGGGIGMGMPLSTGAAVACPDRHVLALQGDGGGMYTPQALWTQAREGLNVTTLIFSNGKYQILKVEQARAGVANPGEASKALTSLQNPTIDWCSLAKGMGVPAVRPGSAESLVHELRRAQEEPGPHLIELVI